MFERICTRLQMSTWFPVNTAPRASVQNERKRFFNDRVEFQTTLQRYKQFILYNIYLTIIET